MPGGQNINSILRGSFRFLASLKIAIPLLVVLIAATIIGSVFPEPELFASWWYLGLLGLLGLSLLLITIQHIPLILKRKGRNAMIGVVATHAGILLLIAGAIYGGMSGFRYNVRAIEQEMTIVPGLPFVIRLDELLIEEYPPEMFEHIRPENVLNKTQESRITLYKNGQSWIEAVTAPGRPVALGDTRILPSLTDVGWYFELIVTDALGREKTIPVRPWAPPMIQAGGQQLMAHSLMDEGTASAQLFTIADEQMKPLGVVSEGVDFEMEGYSIRLGPFKRYTGLSVYNRPQTPLLVAGCVLMLAGLVWHFYHRHKDRARERRGQDVHA
jgi:hypothetical protein